MKRIVAVGLLSSLLLASCNQNTALPQAASDQNTAPLASSQTELDGTLMNFDPTAPGFDPNKVVYDPRGARQRLSPLTVSEQRPVVTDPDPNYVPDTSTGGLTAQALNAWPTLSYGATGEDVQAMQRLLRAHGYSLTADGSFGPATLSAVKAFQSSRGLTADGVVGPMTWGKLIVTVQYGSQGEAVKAVQDYLNIAEDGSFGPDTLAAVKAFQSNHGLTADGVVGPMTWQALVAGGTMTTTPSDPVTTPARSEILTRGKRWVDMNVPYSMYNYFEGWRTDCSGFVSMAWNLRTSSGGKINANTSSLWLHSYRISSPDSLLPGDAINSSTANGALGGANHVILFVKWEDKTKRQFLAYEESGSRGAIARSYVMFQNNGAWWLKRASDGYVYSSLGDWFFLRRKGL